MNRFPSITKKKLSDWTITIVLSAIVAVVCYVYYRFTGEGGEGSRFWSRYTADTGMIVIGISFLMSSLAYYFGGIFKKGLHLRQHIGLAGFYIEIVHLYFALDFAIHSPKIAFSTSSRVISFIFALAATIIFLHMVLISNTTSMKLLGTKGWRVFLRIGGYTAFIYAVVHLWIRKWGLWKEWNNGEMEFLPPLSLAVTVFAIIVVLMRIILWISTMKKKSLIEA